MRKLNRAILLTSTLIASAIGGAAMAQDAAKDTDNTDVTDQAVKTIIIHAERSKAAATAPSKASLDQGEPQSIVSRPFIETSIPETADFTYIANITPSASGSGSSNGPGFGEAKTTLRGFKDGNYNVTFDAIPWGDTNNPTHHSNSFFPASTVGATIVDRGPGAVGDLGQANYGGNIKMFSNKVTDDSSLTLRETIGSWNSWQSVAVYQTGKIAQLHDLKGFINLQMNGSDGALTYSKMHSGNATTKWVLPISENWNLTLFGMYNANEWHNSDNPGGTAYQIKTYGKNFLLNNDPNSPAYYGYNVFNKHTVFSYAKLEGELPLGFKMDNTVYNIYYSNNTDTGLNLAADSSLISTSNPGGYTGLGTYISTSAATGGSADHKYNASGYNKLNHYMTWGDMLRFKREFSAGLMHAGIWVETAKTNRHTYDYDLYLNRAPDHREKKYCMVYSGTTCTTYGTTDLDTYAYQEQSNWWQMQTYADFEWHVTDALTVTPGVKYVSMKRNVMAPVIKSPRQVQYASNKNTATLKNLSVNYKLAHNWSVYGQYAEGMYLPDIAALYVINPSTNTAEPQLSTNYQFGTVFQSKHIAIDADIYRIDLTNLLASTADKNTYVNIGKAKAHGIEGQVSYAFDNGVTLFANGSSNAYVDSTTGYQISGAPLTTTGLGALYHQGPWSGSLLYKQTGKQYADNTQTYAINAYDSVDLSVNYEFGRYRIKAQANNLFDNQSLVSTKGSGVLQTYSYQTGQNFQLTLIAKF